jgi:hypothetical protein
LGSSPGRAVDVGFEIFIELVVRRHVVTLAAFFV